MCSQEFLRYSTFWILIQTIGKLGKNLHSTFNRYPEWILERSLLVFCVESDRILLIKASEVKKNLHQVFGCNQERFSREFLKTLYSRLWSSNLENWCPQFCKFVILTQQIFSGFNHGHPEWIYEFFEHFYGGQ